MTVPKSPMQRRQEDGEGKGLSAAAGVFRNHMNSEGEGAKAMQTIEANSAQGQLIALQEEKTRLERKIAEMVTRLRAGTLDGAGADELKDCSDDIARIDRAISKAEELCEVEEMKRRAIATAEGRAKFDAALAKAQAAREEFLKLYRAACVALGAFCSAYDAANTCAPQVSTSFGILPQDQTALRALPLGDAPARALDGLHSFTDSNWKTAFQILPMKAER